jgi:hypothetical protein
LAIGAAPVVVAQAVVGRPAELKGGAFPTDPEYELTAVRLFPAPTAGTLTSQAENRFQERLRYSGNRWEAIFLHEGKHVRWGGTYSTHGNTLTSVVNFGLRAGETLVDRYESDGRRLTVQFTPPNGPLTQITFTRQ